MLRFQDPLSTWGTGATSRTNMLASSNGWMQVDSGLACAQSDPAIPGGWTLVYDGSGNGTSAFSLGTSLGVVGVAARFKCAALAAQKLFTLWPSSDSGVLFNLSVNSDGSLTAASPNGGGTFGTSAVGVITAGSYQHVEAKVTLGATGGAVQVRVDGVTVLNLSGLSGVGNTGASDYTASRVYLLYQVTSGSWRVAYPMAWDTTGSFNNTFLGPKVSYAITVDSDGTPTDWTIIGSSTTSYGAVDNIPTDGNTSCLEATAVGNITEMGLGTVNPLLTGITALTLVTTERQTTAAASRVQVSLKSGSTYAAGADRAPSYPNFTTYYDLFEQDPANPGAGTLTPTSISAMSIKLERTA